MVSAIFVVSPAQSNSFRQRFLPQRKSMTAKALKLSLGIWRWDRSLDNIFHIFFERFSWSKSGSCWRFGNQKFQVHLKLLKLGERRARPARPRPGNPFRTRHWRCCQRHPLNLHRKAMRSILSLNSRKKDHWICCCRGHSDFLVTLLCTAFSQCNLHCSNSCIYRVISAQLSQNLDHQSHPL